MRSKLWMMRSWAAPAFSVAVALAFNVMVRAADEHPANTSGGGTVTGTVVDKDGKAVANVRVRVTPQHSRATTKPSASDSGTSASASEHTGAGSATTKPSSAGHAQPVAEGKTDSDGKFTLNNVPAGEYNVSASLRGQGSGREKVSVKEGETADVKIKLSEGKPKK